MDTLHAVASPGGDSSKWRAPRFRPPFVRAGSTKKGIVEGAGEPPEVQILTNGEPVRIQVFESELTVPRSRAEVFRFFAEAGNLETITPSWLRFRILTPTPIRMECGAEIRYALRLHGVPVRWRTEITVWDPPHRFIDEQRRGPFRLWRHEHRFEEIPGGTRMTDLVEYTVPGGPLSHWIERWFVRPDVERIFAHRGERIAERFGADPFVSDR